MLHATASHDDFFYSDKYSLNYVISSDLSSGKLS